MWKVVANESERRIAHTRPRVELLATPPSDQLNTTLVVVVMISYYYYY